MFGNIHFHTNAGDEKRDDDSRCDINDCDIEYPVGLCTFSRATEDVFIMA